MLKTYSRRGWGRVILTEAKFLIRGFLYQAILFIYVYNWSIENRSVLSCYPFPASRRNSRYFWQLLLSFPYEEVVKTYDKAMCGYKIYEDIGLERTPQVLRDST